MSRASIPVQFTPIFFLLRVYLLTLKFRDFLVPRIEFKDSSYTIDEEASMLSATLVRSGDLSQRSAVRCYTRQKTARAGVDYYERSNSDDDVVTFEAGERTQECPVAIIDDSFYEGNEEFRLVLGQLQLQHGIGRSLIGKKSQTTIRIVDNNDRMFNEYYFILFGWFYSHHIGRWYNGASSSILNYTYAICIALWPHKLFTKNIFFTRVRDWIRTEKTFR